MGPIRNRLADSAVASICSIASHQPVKAEGDLVVYAFDDSPPESEQVEANRKYVITAEDFESHFSPSEFGPSYSVWIPWDAVGGQAQSISVVPVFRHCRWRGRGRRSFSQPAVGRGRYAGPTCEETSPCRADVSRTCSTSPSKTKTSRSTPPRMTRRRGNSSEYSNQYDSAARVDATARHAAGRADTDSASATPTRPSLQEIFEARRSCRDGIVSY